MPDIEEYSLFYLSEYVAFKEGLAFKDSVDDSNVSKNSEYVRIFRIFRIFRLLLQSKLSYPPAQLFELCCINHLLIALNEIYESCQFEYES